jgi:hypothetical protein
MKEACDDIHSKVWYHICGRARLSWLFVVVIDHVEPFTNPSRRFNGILAFKSIQVQQGGA